MSQQVNLRMERGEAIAREFGNVTRIDEGHYQVRSQSREMQYDVIAGEWGWLGQVAHPDSEREPTKRV